MRIDEIPHPSIPEDVFMMTKNEMTKAANRLAASLADHHGLKLKHTTALSLLASTLGFPNANTMLANAETAHAADERRPYTVSWIWSYAEHGFLTGALLTQEEAVRLERTLRRIANVAAIDDIVVVPDTGDIAADLASLVKEELLPAFNEEEAASLLHGLLEDTAKDTVPASWKSSLEDILAMSDQIALSNIMSYAYHSAGQNEGGKLDAGELSQYRLMLRDAVYMPLRDLISGFPDIDPMEFRAMVKAAIDKSRAGKKPAPASAPKGEYDDFNG